MLERYFNMCVYCWTIYNSKDIDPVYIFDIHQLMNGPTKCTIINNGILLNYKEITGQITKFWSHYIYVYTYIISMWNMKVEREMKDIKGHMQHTIRE